jgi:hypothetical protein
MENLKFLKEEAKKGYLKGSLLSQIIHEQKEIEFLKEQICNEITDETIITESKNCHKTMNKHCEEFGVLLDEKTFTDGFYYGAHFIIEYFKNL